MVPLSKNIEDQGNAVWHNSEVVNGKFWLENPGYLLSIPPRVSKYADISEDALLQCHVDIAGRDGVGFFNGCLTTIGDFTALAFAETLPERIAVLSYLTEVYIVIDGKIKLTVFASILLVSRQVTDSLHRR
jgi:hypothetical protein